MTALPIRQDYSPSELRRLAGREPDRRAALRLLAVANALEGMPRAEAAPWPGWSGRRCAMRCCASTRRAPRGFTTSLARGAPSG